MRGPLAHNNPAPCSAGILPALADWMYRERLGNQKRPACVLILGMDMSTFRWVLGLWFVLSLALGFGFMKYAWGYFLRRPSVHQDVRNMSALEAIGYFDLSPEVNPNFDVKGIVLEQLSEIPVTAERGSNYYHQWVQPLQAARRAGFDPVAAPKLPEAEVTAAIQSFRYTGLASQKYQSEKWLSGLVMRFLAADGELLYLVSACGGEVYNDHYPYYEVLFAGTWKYFTRRCITSTLPVSRDLSPCSSYSAQLAPSFSSVLVGFASVCINSFATFVEPLSQDPDRDT